MAFQYNIIKMFENEKAEGRLLTLISLLMKKYQKGKSVSEAADELEENISMIQPFYDLIAQNPEASDEDILIMYKEQEKIMLF